MCIRSAPAPDLLSQIEEYQNAIEETVTRHLGRIAQVRAQPNCLSLRNPPPGHNCCRHVPC